LATIRKNALVMEQDPRQSASSKKSCGSAFAGCRTVARMDIRLHLQFPYELWPTAGAHRFS